MQDSRDGKSSIEPIDLADVVSGEVQTIVRAWRKWRGFRALPAREDASLHDLGRTLANISLLEVLDGGQDYAFRVIGDAHRQAYQSDYTGRHMRDVIAVAPRFGRLLKASCDLVRTTARAYAFRGFVGRDAPDAEFSRFETCYLPLGPSRADVTHIMNAAAYTMRSQL